MITEKNESINQCKQTLKEEFVRLDVIVDKVVDSVSLWYFFPELKEKPVMIDLWGLTGVEESSLVQRLPELLNFHNKFYQFKQEHTSDYEQAIEDNDQNHQEKNEENHTDFLSDENFYNSSLTSNISEIMNRF